MKTFADSQTKWKDCCESNPAVDKDEGNNIISLLLLTDIADVQQGTKRLLSFGAMTL